ncbi:hypothetical protein [Paludisphaera rhizosphaerae]|uniref:hypothetical protein n=1 Tax=Paludisphaera rhizosphaerae TaxID=2711216 RepID=UPI0013EAB449|nr:hypothetical protein [Paludisphaera rhizosphaerae]
MYDVGLLEQKFAKIGARLRPAEEGGRRPIASDGGIVLDIRNDGDGEFFQVVGRQEGPAEVEVLDVQPKDRHLLLMVRMLRGKQKFLCGHDERHWFVAAIPESAPVGTVRAAKEALKPPEVRAAQARAGLDARRGNRRKNAANRRQGEWFFLPSPRLVVDPKLVLVQEPIRRGGGKAHWCEFLYRTGGRAVHVCRRHPNGVDAATYHRILTKNPEAKNWGWRTMVRDAEVYARGRISHPDHRTITLHGWHRVIMNTETQAAAMRNVAFLD